MAENVKKKKKQKEVLEGFEKFNRVSKPTNAVLHVIFILAALACVVPVLLVVAISFSAEESIQQYGYSFIPKIVSLEGYAYLVTQGSRNLSVRYCCRYSPGRPAHYTDGLCTFQTYLQIKRLPDYGGVYPYGI